MEVSCIVLGTGWQNGDRIAQGTIERCKTDLPLLSVSGTIHTSVSRQSKPY